MQHVSVSNHYLNTMGVKAKKLVGSCTILHIITILYYIMFRKFQLTALKRQQFLASSYSNALNSSHCHSEADLKGGLRFIVLVGLCFMTFCDFSRLYDRKK